MGTRSTLHSTALHHKTPQVQAAALSVDITPVREVPLGAGLYDDSEWSVDSRLEVGFVALWEGNGPPLVFVSVDALYAGTRIRQAIEDSLPGIPKENIVLGATHTHAAPMLDDTKPSLGEPDPEHMDIVVDRIRMTCRALLDPDRRQPVTLRVGKRNADHTVNRRRIKMVTWVWPPRFNEFRWQPDFWGKRDETVTVLEVLGADGPLCVIWNYACHPVHFPKRNTVSSHFPGVVRTEIRRRAKSDIPVLFFQGFSGDIRPLGMAEDRIPPNLRHLYRRARFGPSWALQAWTVEKYSAWTRTLAQRVLEALAKAVPLPSVDQGEAMFWASRLSVPRTDFVEPVGPDVTVQYVRIGSEFSLLAVGAEVVVEYAKFARRLMKTKYSMLVGCADEVVGYLPTTKIMQQGGYEGGEYLKYFGLRALTPDVEENLRSHIRDVVSEKS